MYRKGNLKWLFAVLLLLLVSACTGNGKFVNTGTDPEIQAVAEIPETPTEPEVVVEPIFDEAVGFESFMDRMMVDLKANFLDQTLLTDEKRKVDTNFLFSAFVGEDNYDVTTPLGRMMGDSLASRMQNEGLQVIEVRLSRSMRIHKKFGMLAMSLDMQKLFSEHQATFMITGSYTITPRYVYVMARVIGNTSQVIYASSGVWLPRTPMVNYLLNYRQPTIKVEPAD
ncbi:hypothetical protein KAI46_01060 [bacterium]|nr:hypothetical protein [bacterium]